MGIDGSDGLPESGVKEDLDFFVGSTLHFGGNFDPVVAVLGLELK